MLERLTESRTFPGPMKNPMNISTNEATLHDRSRVSALTKDPIAKELTTNSGGPAIMKWQFLLAGIVAAGLFASAPDAAAFPGPPPAPPAFHPPGGFPGGGFHGGELPFGPPRGEFPFGGPPRGEFPHGGAGMREPSRLAESHGRFRDFEGHRPSSEHDRPSERDRSFDRDRSSERDRSDRYKDDSSDKDRDRPSDKDKDRPSDKDKDSSSDKDKGKDRYYGNGYAWGSDDDGAYDGDDSTAGDSYSGDYSTNGDDSSNGNSSNGNSSNGNSSNSNSSNSNSSNDNSSKGDSYDQTGASSSLLRDVQRATKDIQAELARRGYYNGPIDGLPRPETTNAIRYFQEDQGLPATGQVDPRFINRLARPMSANH
jgi:hypothetical protein